MGDDKVKFIRRREIYRDTCSVIADEIRDLMSKREILDEKRRHRIVSLKHRITDKLEKIKEIDENILILKQYTDEYKKEIHQILYYHEQFFDLFEEIELITGSGRKPTGEEIGYNNRCSSKFPSQKTLQHMKEEYIQSFTIHGLTKIFTGTRIESIFWACIVLIGMCVSNVVMYQLLRKYYRYEIYTDVSVKITNKNFFPSITFCDPKMFRENYFAYCGVPKGSKHDSPDLPCRKPFRNRTEVVSHLEGKGWSNGYFNVKNCKTLGVKDCTSHKYLKSLSRYNNMCFTLNWNGDLYDEYGHMDIQFEMNKTANVRYSRYLAAFIHDPKVHELDLSNRVIIEPSKESEFKISKAILKRLPHPYPSNCTTGKEGDIFPGKYTRLNCKWSMERIEIFKQCGDIYDYHKQFIPPHILKQYHNENQSINTFLKCKEDSYTNNWTLDATGKCPVPCEEVQLSTTSTVHEVRKEKEFSTRSSEFKKDHNANKTVYHVHVQMNNIDSYKVFTERPIHSWDGIVGQVGGVLGLITGTSFISIIELIVCFILCLLHNVVKRKKRDDGLMTDWV